MKLAFLIHFVTCEKEDTFKPMLVNCLLDEEELIPNDVALEACKIVLKTANLAEADLESFVRGFDYHI
jgi:hypothetical protein